MILADAHVHIYDCFTVSDFLDASVSNFSVEAAGPGLRDSFSTILMLTEGAHENWFQRLAGLIRTEESNKINPNPHWTFHHTKERCSIEARRNDGESLFLIAGRQIVTSENLEVLAVATEKIISDGATLRKTVQDIIEAGAIPIIPWGVGKWVGRRGEILREYLNDRKGTGLFLGDNGGRPGFWSRPSHFELAAKKGIRVLPGSDPLPFERESSKPGSFGFSMPYALNTEYPARDLKRLLMKKENEIIAYGSLEKPFRFFRNQLAMQLKKRLHKTKTEN